MNNNDISKPSVTIRQVAGDDQFYKTIEKELEGNGTNARKFWNLLYCENTQKSSPRLWAIAVEGQLMGYVITFDFYQATYITCLQINEAHRGEGWGSMLLQHICKDPNRTYVLLSEVAMSDSEQLSVCVRKKMFYLKNGFRTAPVKWHSPGVTIGDRTVIGAGSVVVRDIPSDCVAVGNPCRVIKRVNQKQD
ncbi:MAG: GNAT family N-acetyltransferase [Prevotella sp.]|nr:GNAT family N-acetyltransferase [Prevotella sp.]